MFLWTSARRNCGTGVTSPSSAYGQCTLARLACTLRDTQFEKIDNIAHKLHPENNLRILIESGLRSAHHSLKSVHNN